MKYIRLTNHGDEGDEDDGEDVDVFQDDDDEGDGQVLGSCKAFQVISQEEDEIDDDEDVRPGHVESEVLGSCNAFEMRVSRGVKKFLIETLLDFQNNWIEKFKFLTFNWVKVFSTF